MRSIILAATAALAFNAPVFAETAAKPAVTIQAPWARATPGGAGNGAAYVTLTAPADSADVLLSVETPAADRAEVHEHVHEGGIMKMRRVEKLELKPGATVTMEPMGYHLMLLGLKAPLKAGDTVHLNLTFQNAGKVAVDAPVIAIGAAAPAVVAPASQDHSHH